MSLQDSTQGYILSSPRTVFTLLSIIVDTREEDEYQQTPLHDDENPQRRML